MKYFSTKNSRSTVCEYVGKFSYTIQLLYLIMSSNIITPPTPQVYGGVFSLVRLLYHLFVPRIHLYKRNTLPHGACYTV